MKKYYNMVLLFIKMVYLILQVIINNHYYKHYIVQNLIYCLFPLAVHMFRFLSYFYKLLDRELNNEIH